MSHWSEEAKGTLPHYQKEEQLWKVNSSLPPFFKMSDLQEHAHQNYLDSLGR